MDVQSEDQIRAGDHLQVVNDPVVSRGGRDGNFRPMRERMRACRGDAQSVFACQADDLAAQASDFAPCFGDVLTNRSADLDHRVMHLPLDLLLEPLLPLGKHLLDVRLQLARLGIDDLKLLFDAEREGGLEHSCSLS